MHHMLANIADILMNDEAKVNQQIPLNCPSCQVFEYSYNGRKVSFVENNKDSADKVIYRDIIYELDAWNMVVVDENDKQTDSLRSSFNKVQSKISLATGLAT